MQALRPREQRHVFGAVVTDQNDPTRLRLRLLAECDEAEALRVHRSCLEEGVEFLLDYGPSEGWDRYLLQLKDYTEGRNLPPGYVPSSFFVATLGKNREILGRISLRHTVATPFLASYGGHIGYVVAPWFRRQGYATEMLRQALKLAASQGIAQALLTTSDTNIGSQRVIERCGGVLRDRIVTETEETLYRYWVQTSRPLPSSNEEPEK
jgi:predicted acetyltransferase